MRPDVAALREAIDARLHARATFSSDTYGDQPIVFSGRQLKSFVPEPIAEARALARSPEMAHHGEAYVFWRQAKLLEGFEDDYDFRGHFSRYYPTYEVMNNDQLRGYFSWRTRWRRGEALPTETSFIYVCAYELLHGVGVADARAGYDELSRLIADYGEEDPRLARNIGDWLDGYVVYWGLPAELLGRLSHAWADAALAVLVGWEQASDEALFDALLLLSSYHLETSKLYKTYPDEVRRVVCSTYRGAAAHHKGLKRSLVEAYFGVSAEQDWALLPNAVFADPLARDAYEYEVSPLDRIRCHRGLWARDRYAGNLRPNKKLGKLLKTIDAVMRETLGFEPALEAPLATQYIHKLVADETRSLVEARREAERRAVRIDLSKLGSIRAAADVTRDRLIVEEDEPVPINNSPKGASNPASAEDAAPAPSLADQPAGLAQRFSQAATSGGAALSEDCLSLTGLNVLSEPEGRTMDGPKACVLSEGLSSAAAAPERGAGSLSGSWTSPAGWSASDGGRIEGASHHEIEPPIVLPQADTIELTDDERSLLALLLDGGDLRTWERGRGTMASLAVDALNERLIDAIGDVPIDAAADPPEIFEDYRDDVRELIGG